MFVSKYKTPLGQNKWSGRILELQNEAKRTKTNRSAGILYREGRGGTVYQGFASKSSPRGAGTDTWAA